MKPALLKLFLLLGAATAHASSSESPKDIQGDLISDPNKVSDQKFDYIIVGGGTTGLTVASELTKNESITVLVIENGFAFSGGQKVEDYNRLFASNFDPKYTTSPAKINNQTLSIRSGKGLGGSTLLSKAAWSRPDKVQLDSWEKVLGNKDWNWKDLKTYMDKAEAARAPTSKQVAAGHYFDASCHGLSGTVHAAALDTEDTWSPVPRALMNTSFDLGIPTRKDLNCGELRGVSMVLHNVLNDNTTRADAAIEWLHPAYKRKNLKVLTGQMVGKVLFDDSGLKANGVNFGTNKHVQFNAYAKKEVLLAAGSIMSPLILQYSGIGIKSVLEEAGVKQRVELPVGLNMQDQTSTTVSNKIKSSAKGQGQAVYFANFTETFGDQHVQANKLLDKNIEQWAKDTVENGGSQNVTALNIQYKAIKDWILKDDVAVSVLSLDANGKMKFDIANLLPFTRGAVRILSEDAYLLQYENNPMYLLNEFDVLAQAAASKLARKLSSSGKMKEYWDSEYIPGYDLDSEADIDKWSDYIKKNFRPNSHPIGTCSMMSKDLGGVVDSKGQVYGTKGLRVIDASIIPTPVSAHPTALLYGMALKIADLIVKDLKD